MKSVIVTKKLIATWYNPLDEFDMTRWSGIKLMICYLLSLIPWLSVNCNKLFCQDTILWFK